MKVIGLTGGTGSGKSVVSRRLEKAGARIVDADKIGHEIIEKGKPAYTEIVEYFGNGMLDEQGHIVRRRLGEIVFHDAQKLAFLNQCTHKYIIAEVKRQIAEAKEMGRAKAVVIDAPLLLEAGLERLCDAVWVVFAEEEVRIRRIMERDGVSYELAQARIGKQKPWAEYEKAADVIIDNSRDIPFLEKQLQKLLETL
ncbi:MAG: dephospho-CoA kinase [Anaerotignum sp.]|nr:dephospho-CoA kinase [Anaerotignum sp.]